MKIHYFFFPLLILLSACALKLDNELTDAHVKIVDTNFYMIPIAQSVSAESYYGFEDERKRWSIAVKNVDKDMALLNKTYEEKNLKKLGFDLLLKKDIIYRAIYPGIWVECEDKKRQLTRYYMFLDMNTSRVSVKGNLPTSRVQNWGLAVRESMQSLYTEDPATWNED